MTPKMKIIPVPIRSDNYMYVLQESKAVGEKSKAFLIDPAAPDALDKVSALPEGKSLDIVGVLTTHHHEDHAGGNPGIAKALPSAIIYGGSSQVRAVSEIIKDGDSLTLGDSINIRCLATPCHTRDSICYYVTDGDQKAVFTGDTLFQGGCGRFFEGTPEEMHASLSYLGTLPEDTVVYNGHEYTKGNVKFAKTIDPSNPDIGRLEELCASNEIMAGKSTIGDEKKWNVFMRLGDETIKKATGAEDAAAVMGKLREMKNAM